MSGEYLLRLVLSILQRFSLMIASVEELRTTVILLVTALIPN